MSPDKHKLVFGVDIGGLFKTEEETKHDKGRLVDICKFQDVFSALMVLHAVKHRQLPCRELLNGQLREGYGHAMHILPQTKRAARIRAWG